MIKSYFTIFYFNKKTSFIISLFLLLYTGIYCQNQQYADSLEVVYYKDKLNDQERLKILNELAVSSSIPEKKLKFSLELIQTARSLNSYYYLYEGFLQKGNALRSKGDLSKALESYFQAAKYAPKEDSNRELGIVNITIADVYSLMGNHKNSVIYYHSAIDILRKEKDSINLGAALLNLGDEHFKQSELDSAMSYFKESGEIFKIIRSRIGVAYNLGGVGLIYAKKGKYRLAEKNINKAIELLTELGDYSPICEYLLNMSEIYFEKDNQMAAVNFAKNSLELAEQYGLKKEISDANLRLSELYELSGDLPKSFGYYKNHIVFRDSVSNIESIRKIADLRTDFEIKKKQDEIVLLEKKAEISLLESKREKNMTFASIIVSVLIFLLALGVFRRYKYINKTSRIIQLETDKSEKLLLNILPEGTANELKQSGKVKAKQFDSVSVMFTDFKNFTKHSQYLTPEELVKSVDFYFSKFDSIIEKYELEKIKTIGDAYMCAGGLPVPTTNHAEKMIQAAFEITEFIESVKENNTQNIKHFNIRIGINTGPVIAGVVGLKKFSYDIWGDTVNVGSRLESTSESGKINISETTYQLIKNKYDCEYRGEIHVKNKGKMKMYFVINKNKITKDQVLEKIKL